MQADLSIVQKINFYLSDYILVILLVGTGIFFSIKTRFVQVRCFGEGMRSVFGKISLHGGKQESGLSSFQALATAVAAQVGTGNIIGASGAILTGGPGAIFWMWIIAFFGMATIYSEAVLAQETKTVKADGTVHGGPVYYINKAFPNGFGKFLAGFFAVAITLALGFMGSMVQSNSIGETFSNALGIPTWVIGIAVTVIAGLIFLGGIQRIAFVTEKLVPVMAVLYILGGFAVLIMRIRFIPETFGMIFKYAFEPNAIIGGSLGYALKTAISQGVKRGLFSNEAGMGSTPHAHAMANVKKPHNQGVVAMIGLFIDTFVVLTMEFSPPVRPMESAKQTWHSSRSLTASARASARSSSRSACCSSRSPRSSAGTSSARSMWNISSAKRRSRSILCSRWCLSSSAPACPMTSSGSLRICSISSWSSRTSLLCLRSLRS